MEMRPVLFAVTLLLAPHLPVTAAPTADTEAPAATDLDTLSTGGVTLRADAVDNLRFSGDPATLTTITETAELDTLTPDLDTPTEKSDILSLDKDTPTANPATFTAVPDAPSADSDIVTTRPGTLAVSAPSLVAEPADETTVTTDEDTNTLRLTVHTTDAINPNPVTVITEQDMVTTHPTTVGTTTTPFVPVCPMGCECEHLEVHCSRTGLVRFPGMLDPGTTYLDVGHNRITAIRDDELANLGLTALSSLICDDNEIETLEPHAFRGLLQLSLVQLSGNRIRTVPLHVFAPSLSLRHIDLTGNPLQLSLLGPVFSALQLEWLDLDYCNISMLPGSSFRDMPGLRYLNLSGNRLRSLDPTEFYTLRYLRYVKLSGNPLLCDCKMKPLWRWFKQQSVHVDAKCIAPSNGSTQSWNFLELLRCDQ